MKKIILLFALCSSFAFSQSDNVDTTVNLLTAPYWLDTLTSSIDTAIITPVAQSQAGVTTFAITLVCPSGADTVSVEAISKDGLTYTKRAGFNVMTGSAVDGTTGLPSSTTVTKYLIFDSRVAKFRFISLSNDASTTIIKFEGQR